MYTIPTDKFYLHLRPFDNAIRVSIYKLNASGERIYFLDNFYEYTTFITMPINKMSSQFFELNEDEIMNHVVLTNI